jgi:hypothetical protein
MNRLHVPLLSIAALLSGCGSSEPGNMCLEQACPHPAAVRLRAWARSTDHLTVRTYDVSEPGIRATFESDLAAGREILDIRAPFLTVSSQSYGSDRGITVIDVILPDYTAGRTVAMVGYLTSYEGCPITLGPTICGTRTGSGHVFTEATSGCRPVEIPINR